MKCYSGMDYLRIGIASQFGLDKENFEPRIQWVHDHEDELESFILKADDYYQYAAAVMAYREAQAGKPSGHLVGLDACASGAQLLSVISGCKVGALNTGAAGQERKDVYLIVTDEMNKLLHSSIKFDRPTVKNAVMTVFYGSKMEPIYAFGADTDELEAFYKATQTVCPGASRLLPTFLDLHDEERAEYRWELPDGFEAVYRVPETVEDRIEIDTLDPHITFNYRYVINQAKEKDVALAAHITHSVDALIVRELTARCNYNPSDLDTCSRLLIERIQCHQEADPKEILRNEQLRKKHDFLSIEGIEYINSSSVKRMSLEYCKELLQMISKVKKHQSFQVLTIHDEFKCLPNHMNMVRQTYIDLLAELADSTILDSILTNITGEPYHFEKLSDDLSTKIRQGEYALA